jgi:DNA transformation protein
MGAEDLKALFEPFGSVTVRGMFGGSEIYAESLCFAIESGAESAAEKSARESESVLRKTSPPFTYVAKGMSRPTSYWSLPAIAHDEADELRRWAGRGLDAARRAAAAKAPRKGKRPKSRAEAK